MMSDLGLGIGDENLDLIESEKVLEELGIAVPETDPAVFAPDFFDEDVMVKNDVLFNQTHASSSGSSFSVLAATEDVQAQPLELNADVTSAADISTPALKYDDEECAYNEFLLFKSTTTVSPSKEVFGEGNEEGKEDEDIASDKASTQSAVEDIPDTDLDDDKGGEKKQDSDDGENKDEENEEDKFSKSSLSGPSTPASRPESTTIHLLPKPNMPKIEPGKVIVLNKTPEKASSYSTRVTRSGGRRAKRKLSDDDEDYVVEEEEGQSTRSTRSSRKMARHDDATSSPKRTSRASVREKRLTKKPLRYESAADEHNSDSDMDEGESDLFETVVRRVKKTKKKGPNYYEENQIVYYQENGGKTLKIPHCTVRIPRMSKEEIEEFTGTSASSTGSTDDSERILLEICIDNFESAKEAIKGGANRIELCASLLEGGLTPPVSFLTLLKETFNVPVFVMIRPRGGDFLYSDEEIEMMSRDISNFKQCGADGFVFGVLTKDCDVDVKSNKYLKEAAYPLPCTFHRAFDKVAKPFDALEKIIEMGFSRILTSGLESSAQVGIPTLKRLVKTAGDRIVIMAGAGINEKNVAEIVEKTGVKEVHGSASTTRQSLMSSASVSTSDKTRTPGRRGKSAKTSNSAVSMGATSDDVIKVTDSNLVAKILKSANRRRRV